MATKPTGKVLLNKLAVEVLTYLKDKHSEIDFNFKKKISIKWFVGLGLKGDQTIVGMMFNENLTNIFTIYASSLEEALASKEAFINGYLLNEEN